MPSRNASADRRATRLAVSLALLVLTAGAALTGDRGLAATNSQAAGAEGVPQGPTTAPLLVVKTPEARLLPLRSGLQLVVVEDHRIPMVRLHLEVAGGGEARSVEEGVTAHLMADSLLAGTAVRTQGQLAAAIEDLSSGISVRLTDEGNLEMDASSLAEDAPELLRLMAEVLTRPRFPEETLASAYAGRRLNAAAQRSELYLLLLERLWSTVYERSKPLVPRAPELSGSRMRDDVLRFYEKRISPDRTVIVVTGDVSTEAWQRLATDTLGSWVGGAGANAVREEPDLRPVRIDGETAAIVDVPDAQLTYLGIGAAVVAQTHADRDRLIIMNSVLGGSVQSRLMRRLRWETAYSYSSGSEMRDAGRDQHLWYAAATAAPKDAAATLDAMMKEIDRMRRELVTEDEFMAAKRQYIGLQARETQTPLGLLNLHVGLWRNGLPMNHLNTLNKRVEAITPEDVRRVAREYLAQDRLRVVVVGDAASLTSAVRSYGQVAIYDATGERRGAVQ